MNEDDPYLYEYDAEKERRRKVECAACGVKLKLGDANIHHVNEVKSDNRPENLVPMHPGCHRRHHALKRRAKQGVASG